MQFIAEKCNNKQLVINLFIFEILLLANVSFYLPKYLHIRISIQVKFLLIDISSTCEKDIVHISKNMDQIIIYYIKTVTSNT